MDIIKKEKIEIEYWRNSNWEGPGMFTANNYLVKSTEAHIFNYKIKKYNGKIGNPANILELGAGQGWASCFLKKFVYPEAHFTVTDISPYAVESISNWENLFDINIEEKLACKSYELPFEEEQFDLIFCFAAAHHFVLLEKTLQACCRVLKPGGVIAFLYEPTCSKLMYKWHFRYVNNYNQRIPEDVFIPQDLLDIADRCDLRGEHYYDPSVPVIRSVALGVYFKILQTLPFLQKVLPSSSDFFFNKK